MRTILLIMIGLSTFLSADFTRDANGIVSDSITGLAWQDDYADNGDAVKQSNWADALSYCEALTLGGNDDWRLPNFNELYSIGDRSTFNPAIDSTFTNVISDYYYWSATTNAFIRGDAWLVDSYYGNDASFGKSYSFYVRCVRDGQ